MANYNKAKEKFIFKLKYDNTQQKINMQWFSIL